MKIESSKNPRVKYVEALQGKSRLRHEDGCFVAEGIKLVKEAPKEQLVDVYVSESFLSQNGDEDLCGVPYTEVSDAAFKAMSDTLSPQGVLAVIKIRKWDEETLLNDPGALLLILEDIKDPGNLGTLLRSAEGAGVTGVIMSRDSADIYNPKTVRSTMGSVYRVPHVVSDDLKDFTKRCRERGIRLFAAHLNAAAPYDREDYRGPSGFLIGNESSGLSDALAACADDMIRIPMMGSVESLNAAVAASVILYEAARQRRS